MSRSPHHSIYAYNLEKNELSSLFSEPLDCKKVQAELDITFWFKKRMKVRRSL